MPASSTSLVQRLQAEKEKTLAFFAELTDAEWQKTLYTEGEHWTVREVFAHLVEAEGSILRLMKHIQRGGEGSPLDFDLDAYNQRKVQEVAVLPNEALMARFASHRDATAAWVGALSTDELALEGRHPYLGTAPLEAMIKLLYRHTQLHQRDIRKFLLGE